MPGEQLDADSIFCRAIEIAEEERVGFISRACGNDGELRRQVERLIAAHFAAGSFLNKLPAGVDTGSFRSGSTMTEPVAAREISGAVIGPYQLQRLIGEGGMG